MKSIHVEDPDRPCWCGKWHLTKCRSCGAAIRFGRTPAGKSIPLNADPDPDRGNVCLDGQGGAIVLGNVQAWTARQEGERLYLSHFATCKFALEHRSPRRKAAK